MSQIGLNLRQGTAQRLPAYVALSTSIDAQSTSSVLLRAKSARPNWAHVMLRKSTNATVSTLAWFVQRSFRQQQQPPVFVVAYDYEVDPGDQRRAVGDRR